jgi:hypothetical protein
MKQYVQISGVSPRLADLHVVHSASQPERRIFAVTRAAVSGTAPADALSILNQQLN